MKKDLEKLLKSVDLKTYSALYSNIRIVEVNLTPNIFATGLMYRLYWDEKKFCSFDVFFEIYAKENKKGLELFRKKYGFCKKCFALGIKARIYRTWAGLITQIHAGYVAEEVFGKGTVSMSAQLDSSDVDIQVNYKNKILNYDVKKISRVGVSGVKYTSSRVVPGEKIPIRYEVPDLKTILNPKYKNGKGYYAGYLKFKTAFLDTHLFEVYPNGFVVFAQTIFLEKKKKIDALKNK